MSEVVKEYVDIPYNRRGRPSKRPSNRELAELYSKYSVQEIAKKLGVAVPTVYGWAVEARKEYRAHAKEE